VGEFANVLTVDDAKTVPFLTKRCGTCCMA
jgi:hypothetical protein